MNDKMKADFDKVFQSNTHGDCDICGCHSTDLLFGICQKAVCQRYIEENKVDLDGNSWLAGEYD